MDEQKPYTQISITGYECGGLIDYDGVAYVEEDTWSGLVMCFAKLLTELPDGNNYYIDLPRLEDAINSYKPSKEYVDSIK